MKLYTIVLMMAVATCAFGQRDPSWKVQFGWFSGWGNEPGIYVDSSGTMGIPSSWDKDPIALCSMTMSAEDLETIGERIAAIPVQIPPNSRLKIDDHCHDEREHFVTVTLGSNERAFSYSQQSECMEGETVPEWLSNLVDELSKHYDDIENCETDA